MAKRIIATAGIIAVTLTLSACGTEYLDRTHERHFTTKVISVEGREVTCVIYRIGSRGGLSCDWDGAR